MPPRLIRALVLIFVAQAIHTATSAADEPRSGALPVALSAARGEPKPAADTAAAAPSRALGTNDTCWLISTRYAPQGGTTETLRQQMQYWRLSGRCDWTASDAQQFHTAYDASFPTVLFIHGNLTSTGSAIREAWDLRVALQRQAGGRPFRLAIWSWPSQRVARRPRVDLQIKAQRSDREAALLARTLAELPSETPICLIGYSYGARVIAGALHMAGGGSVGCQRLPSAPLARQGPTNAVLVAAAIDCYSLAPGQRYQFALSQADRLMATRNAADPVLRWYPRLYGRRGPEALGYVGPSRSSAGAMEVVDVTARVGRCHDWLCYAAAGAWICRLGDLCLPAFPVEGPSLAPLAVHSVSND